LNNDTNLVDGVTDPGLDVLGRYSGNRGLETHRVVGSFSPNVWGIYDMHGNVSEWCLDWYQADLGTETVADPPGLASGTSRTVRGGGWNSSAAECRSAARGFDAPSSADPAIGFRLAAPGQPGANL